MRILIVGAGAVGGYFGGRLAEAGKDVTFLVRARQAEALRSHGLRIESPHGNVSIDPQLIMAGQIDGAYDLVLLCIKAYSLDAAIEDCSPGVGPGTMILPELNGMRHLDLLVARFGDKPVLGGVCLIASEMKQDGTIVQLTETHRLVYGERNGGISERITALDQSMQGAGFEARASDHIQQDMWEKWIMLASLGALTCLLRGNVGEIAAAPGGTEIAAAILAESSAISRACGYPPGGDFLSRTGRMLTNASSTLTSSMYRDMSRNAPVEVEQILGDLLHRGQQAGVATPFLAAAYANLRVYDARRNGGAIRIRN